jgi:hypothetical protein
MSSVSILRLRLTWETFDRYPTSTASPQAGIPRRIQSMPLAISTAWLASNDAHQQRLRKGRFGKGSKAFVEPFVDRADRGCRERMAAQLFRYRFDFAR